MDRILLVALFLICTGLARAGEPTAEVELLPGWRMANGHHMAAIEIRLLPGWKTYWRRPGDAGIPPDFDWSGSRNVAELRVHWPAPDVFHQAGLRSVGYHDGVVLPVEVVPARTDAPMRLSLYAELGICRDICVPVSARADTDLPPGGARDDARIRAALADRPLTAREAGARIGCDVALTGDGAILTTRIAVPPLGGSEEVVHEPADPALWISDPDSRRDSDTLVSRARIEAPPGAPLLLDRSTLVTTVLGRDGAVEMRGCD